ncbi:MAG: SPASM domain-containing protein, partial [Patescibacteria group bacterium]
LLESNLTKEADTSCYLKNPWHLQILPDGNVYPCAIMAFYNRPCGNLHKQTLTEIWNDEKLWNGNYYNENVVPLFKKFGGCVCFNKKFKQSVDSGRFKFICLMCKLKTTNF